MMQIMVLVLCSAIAYGQPFPYVAPVPAAPTVSPIIPPVHPFGPSPRPLAPGVPGYNNPYYNQYNRVPGAAVPILTYSSEHTGDGSYSFSFTTADGKQAQEAGYLKDAFIDNAGEPQGTQVVQGSYSYVSPEGTPIQVSYVADENGFRPSGVHIPADGNAVVPIIGDKEKLLDPYNRYDSFNHRNRYNNFGKFNQPYDPRYPYDANRYDNNRYPYDVTKHPYDVNRHPYDVTKHPYDVNRHPYDITRHPYDVTRYNYNNPYNNRYLAPVINKDIKDSKKPE